MRLKMRGDKQLLVWDESEEEPRSRGGKGSMVR